MIELFDSYYDYDVLKKIMLKDGDDDPVFDQLILGRTKWPFPLPVFFLPWGLGRPYWRKSEVEAYMKGFERKTFLPWMSEWRRTNISIKPEDWNTLDLDDKTTWPDKGDLCLRFHTRFHTFWRKKNEEPYWVSPGEEPERAKTGHKFIVMTIEGEPDKD
jgi:hypothetical protein